jgi:hypothetical protein
VALRRKVDEKMANILLLATAWGPKHGGINAFNMDFAQGLVTYLHGTGRVFCVVLDASHADLADAAARGATLLSMERSPEVVTSVSPSVVHTQSSSTNTASHCLVCTIAI